MASSLTAFPDAAGRFGPYGGSYVPETLMAALRQLREEYDRARRDSQFQQAFQRNPNLDNLMLDPTFAEAMNARQDCLREAVGVARALGLPCPAYSSSLDYYDTLRTARLPANLVQAQRDYFGAHTYRRVDRDGVFHTQWAPPREGTADLPAEGHAR